MFGSMIKVLKALSLAAGFVVAFASTSSANHFQVTEVALVAQPAAHNGACPATITFVGRIKANGRGRVTYTFLRSDGAHGPRFTVDFDQAGEKQVSTTWRLGGPGLPFYHGWEAIRILRPNVMFSNRAVFEVRCLRRPTLPTPPDNPMLPPMLPPSPAMQSGRSDWFTSLVGPNCMGTTNIGAASGHRPKAGVSSLGINRILLLPGALDSRPFSLPFVTKSPSASSTRLPGGLRPIARPDLIVQLQAPHIAFAGQNISPLMRLFARNIGAAPAPGTNGAINPANGYLIDVVLSRDGNVPARFAGFSANFVEDALLRGGRRSNTVDLAPGAGRAYPAQGVIPADAPTGNYFICARIDPGNRVGESNEVNNTACVPIHINGRN